MNGFTNIKLFTDDGVSGTTFNRPGFNQMIEEVEKGNIATVVVKDMSRFGRDYLKVGMYTEVFFPQHDVRFIAINNCVDSEKDDNDFTPFRNIINEWYAKDTSKKIKSVFKAKGMSGKPLSSTPPYGYKKSESDKNKWVIDEETSSVVKQIYSLCLNGYGYINRAVQSTFKRL